MRREKMEIKTQVNKQLKQIEDYIELLEVALKLAVFTINIQQKSKLTAQDYIDSAKPVVKYKCSNVWYKSMHEPLV